MAGLALVVAVLALAVATSGAAGSVKRAGGVAYVTKSFERDAGYAKLKASCPRGTQVLSGGEDNNASFNAARLHHSYPVDGPDKRKKPDDGWGVALTSTGDYTFRVYALCADRKVKYVKRTLGANALGQTNQVVGCPGDLRVVGGGHRGSQSLTANSGFVSGAEWAFFVDNHENAPLPFSGFATCVRFPTEVVSESDPDTPFGTQTFVEAECPAGRFVVGGGSSNGGSYDQVGLNATFPGGFAGPPARTWSVWTDNRAGAELPVTAQAVCAPALR